jgi:hypothetical protein
MDIASRSLPYRTHALLIVAGMMLATNAAAQGKAFVYPQQGQSPQQQAQDEAECRTWAAQQSGPAPAAPGVGGHAGGTVKGGARGAAVGAAVGAIAGDAGKGAAAGAVVGGVQGRRGSTQAAAAAQAGAAADTERAFGACMQGRGYSVK